MLKKVLIALLLLAGLTILLAYIKVYLVREGAGGTLFWHDDEAYLFLDSTRSGYRATYLQYVAEIPREFFGDVALPTNKRCYVVVIRITPQEIHNYAAEDLCLGFYTFFADGIYSRNTADGVMWKWSGTQFERATAEEQSAFDPNRAPRGFNFNDVEGWSERGGLTAARDGSEVGFDLGGEKWSLVVRQSRPREVSIDLVRPGHPPQNIWRQSGQPRRVSKTEYERIFGEQ